MKKWLILVVLAVIGLVGWRVWHLNLDSLVNHTPKTAVKVAVSPPKFNKLQHSIDDPTSIWVVVNKARALNPLDYAPTDLALPNVALRLSSSDPEMHIRAEPAHALEQLFAGAAAAGLTKLSLASGYRSYAEQVSVYNGFVHTQGQATADQSSARPGHSEHQTGLAADIAPSGGTCVVEQCFGDMPEGKWVAAHAYEYGFIIRYPAGKESITGYEYEPWHLRYVGVVLATEMHKEGVLTLEEFFNLPAAPNYL